MPMVMVMIMIVIMTVVIMMIPVPISVIIVVMLMPAMLVVSGGNLPMTVMMGLGESGGDCASQRKVGCQQARKKFSIHNNLIKIA